MAVAHVPLSSGVRRTCFLNAGVHDEDGGFQCDGAAFTRFLERRRGRCTCYRGVSREGAPNGCRRKDGRCERSRMHRRLLHRLPVRGEDVVQRGMPAQSARTPPTRSAAAPAIEPHAMPRRERSVPYRAVGPSYSGAGANSDPSAQGGARAGHRRGRWLWREGRTRHAEVDMAMAVALAGVPSSSSQARSRAP